eukprot:15454866-Alexandrium_andersonii.AAC.1
MRASGRTCKDLVQRFGHEFQDLSIPSFGPVSQDLALRHSAASPRTFSYRVSITRARSSSRSAAAASSRTSLSRASA